MSHEGKQEIKKSQSVKKKRRLFKAPLCTFHEMRIIPSRVILRFDIQSRGTQRNFSLLQDR